MPDFLSILAAENDPGPLPEPPCSEVRKLLPQAGDDHHTPTTLREALDRVHALAPEAKARVVTSSSGVERSLYLLEPAGVRCVAFALAHADGAKVEAERLLRPEVRLSISADVLSPLFEDAEGLDVLDETLVHLPFHFGSASSSRRALLAIAEVMRPAELALTVDAGGHPLLATLRHGEGARFDALKWTCGDAELDGVLERLTAHGGELGIETGTFRRAPLPEEITGALRQPHRKRDKAQPYSTGSVRSRLDAVEAVRRDRRQAEVPKLIAALASLDNAGPAGRDVRGALYFTLSAFPTELVGTALRRALRLEEADEVAARLIEALWRHPTVVESCVNQDLPEASRSDPRHALRILRAAKAARIKVPEEIVKELPGELQRWYSGAV